MTFLNPNLNLNLLPVVVFLSCLLAGCGDTKSSVPATAPAKHEHKPPHGGTPVELGNEEYHVELVLDAPAGKLSAYIFDGELENFIRIADPSFEVVAKFPGGEQVLTFNAIANNATGEKVGDTSLFEANADWLRREKSFDGVLKQLTVRNQPYQNVRFNFPKGNDADEKKP